jgi:hypothetical protein
VLLDLFHDHALFVLAFVVGFVALNMFSLLTSALCAKLLVELATLELI